MARNSIEIKEIEGNERWGAVLYGRALPHDKNPPEWGVDPKFEDTVYRGSSIVTTEPLANDYPPLSFEGRWAQLHTITGDGRVVFTPDRDVATPQQIGQGFVLFAQRQKTVEITWSEGFVVIARWDGVRIKPGRGSDRHWSLKFRVLGFQRPPVVDTEGVLDPRSLLASMRSKARKLDGALGTYPPGMAPGFFDGLKESFGVARQAMARVRQSIAAVGSLARAPADTLNEITAMAESARNTLREAKDQIDDTAYEYRMANMRVHTIMDARAWKTSVVEPSDGSLDDLSALIRYIETLLSKPARYVAVAPGESLARVAQREMGDFELWREIAKANGLSSDRVPAGVSQLIIPEV